MAKKLRAKDLAKAAEAEASLLEEFGRLVVSGATEEVLDAHMEKVKEASEKTIAIALALGYHHPTKQ